MKTILLKISFIFLLLGLMGAGCEKEEEQLWEISPTSKSAVIQKEVDGIQFKFCLLNEQGEPATVFTQGENFSFYFSVTNNSNEKFYFYPGYAYSEENDFCRVYSSSQIDEGKPYEFKGADLIGVGAYPFEVGEAYVFKQIWIDNRGSAWRWKYGYYESADQKYLPIGDYSTGFQYRFEFEPHGDNLILSTDTLKFKINFKIQ